MTDEQVQNAINEALLNYQQKEKALRNAVKDLLAHHRIKALDGVSDTLQPRLEKLRELIK